MKDGLLLVDKPGGMTSHDVVGLFRRHLKRKDIGHGGTLDPMATGLLVLLIGKATKLSDYILNGNKSYQTTVQFGIVTDTDDITGQVIQEKSDFQISDEQLNQALSDLSGSVVLPVPIYSAVKVKGKKLYEKARKGEDFKPPEKEMSFNDLQVIDRQEQSLQVAFECTKGSYVRAWGKRLGEILGSGGTLTQLRRTHSSPYGVDQAVKPEEAQELLPEQIYEHSSFIPLSQTLPTWPVIKVEGKDEKLLSNGQISRKLERFLELEYGPRKGLQGIKVLSKGSGRLICLLSIEGPLSFKIRRVFPNQ